MVAPIAVGAIWRLLVIPGFGPVPFFLERWFDIKYQIGSFPEQALLTSIIMDVWHWTPFVTLTMLAGLVRRFRASRSSRQGWMAPIACRSSGM